MHFFETVLAQQNFLPFGQTIYNMNMRTFSVCFLVGLMFVFSLASGETFTSPPPVPGWTHTEEFRSDTSSRHGVVMKGASISYGSPSIAEIDGNPKDGKEVVVIGKDMKVHARRSDGSALWSYAIHDPSCPSSPPVFSSPAVGELYGNGIPYVVVGYGGLTTRNEGCDGGVVAIRGTDGRLAWRFSTKAFDRKVHIFSRHFGVLSTPALADVDGDGRMEIGFGALDRNVYLLDARGRVRWYYLAADTVFSSPAFANIDADPKLEMIIGTDMSFSTALRPPTPAGGFLYAMKTNKRRVKRINFRDPSAYVWKAVFDQVLQSSPVVADVIPENPGPEIVTGSGCFFPQNSRDKRGKWVKIVDGATGKLIRTLNSPNCFNSSPAVGDLDEDGRLEIVATVNGASRFGGDGRGRLVAWKASSPEPMWAIIPRSNGGGDPNLGTIMSPVIADLDGNGSLEVIVSAGGGVAIVNGRDGSPLTCTKSRCTDISLMLYTYASLKGTPAVGDVNNDGILDLFIGGGHAGTRDAVLYGWTSFAGLLQSPAGKLPAYSAPWPMHRGNAERNGRFR